MFNTYNIIIHNSVLSWCRLSARARHSGAEVGRLRLLIDGGWENDCTILTIWYYINTKTGRIWVAVYTYVDINNTYTVYTLHVYVYYIIYITSLTSFDGSLRNNNGCRPEKGFVRTYPVETVRNWRKIRLVIRVGRFQGCDTQLGYNNIVYTI